MLQFRLMLLIELAKQLEGGQGMPDNSKTKALLKDKLSRTSLRVTCFYKYVTKLTLSTTVTR